VRFARLVGRDHELEILLSGLEGLKAGRGSFFLLSGEPGIGKTRLSDELAARAADWGAKVAWGAAWDGGGAPAFWPWIQAVRALRSELREPDERLRRDLGPLWDDADDATENNPGAHDLDLLRFRRFDALRALLQAAAAQRPLVLVLEDLHAADRTSLLALQFVARALRALPVLLLGTHRDAEARLDPELGERIARIARDATTLHLSRLGREQVATLLAGFEPVTPRLVDEVYGASGGNPLFVEEMLRVVRSAGYARAIPEGASAVLRERLARFESPAREALEAAAVLGREVSWSVLSDVCGCSTDAARERLRLPRLAAIIDEASDDALRFSHALFREHLYDQLEPERRTALHLKAGETLARRVTMGLEPTSTRESVARHLLAALPQGDLARALEWARRAGESALSSLAFDRAVELFEGALDVLARLPADPGQTIDVQLELSYALGRAGSAERGRGLCLAAAEQARTLGDGPRLARAALAYGAELRIAVVDPTLVALLEEALGTLDEGDKALRARVLARLAAARQPALDPEPPMQLAREAIALAREVGDPETLLATLYTAGSALVDYARPEERLPLARELIELALPRGELPLAQQGYARAAVDAFELGDLVGAEMAIAAHTRLGDALGHPRWRWRGALMRSMRALIDGRWKDAADAQADAAALAAESDDPNAAPSLYMHHLGVLRARESARRDELDSPWDGAFDSLQDANLWAAAVRGCVLARLGDVESGRRVIDALPSKHWSFASDPMAMSLMADLVASVGDRGWAARLLPLLEPHAGRTLTWGVFGLIWDGPLTQWIGALLGTLGRWREAAAALEDALASAEAVRARPLAARLRRELAIALIELGDRAEAARAGALLDLATTSADELGMTHLRTRIARTRELLGAPPAAAASVRPVRPELTLVREGDIWTLSSAGRTARLKHSRALEILELLVNNAGRQFHVLELGSPEPGTAIDLGDAGEALDAQARSAYRERIAALEDELREAEAWADESRRARLRAELEFIGDELARGTGLGGRDRRAAAAVERARVNVQKRLRGIVHKLAQTEPQLARHLERSLKTGTYVSYR
jgi:tetratricopeptide (TPR) repeat protein